MNIAANIKAHMKETGRKQAHLCKHAKLSASAMSMILAGKRKLRLDEYCAICKALDVRPDFFLQ